MTWTAWARRWGPALAVALAIAYATLRPTPPPSIPLPVWCITCGTLGGVDVVLNVVLFVPLGAALVWGGWSWPRAAVVGFTSSFVIEALQYRMIPGRDSSIGDLLTNTIGGLIGAWAMAHWRVWLLPVAGVARRLTCAATVGMVGLWVLTAWLLHPAVRHQDTYGQWAPHQAQFADFTGRVLSLSLNGMPVPPDLIPGRERYLAALRSGEYVVRAEIISGNETPRLAAIGRASNRVFELFLLGQTGRAMVVRTRQHVGDLALRPLSIALSDAFPVAGVPVTLDGGLTNHAWFARIRDERGVRQRNVPFSIALGWAMLLPWEQPLDETYRWWSALWMAGLAIPGALWGWTAARPRARTRAGASIGQAYWIAVTPAAILVGLTMIPLWCGFAPAHWSEWGGACAGVAIGCAIAATVRSMSDARLATPSRAGAS